MTDHVEPAVPGEEYEREPGPSDSLQTFGAVVQTLREHAGLSRVQLDGSVFPAHGCVGGVGASDAGRVLRGAGGGGLGEHRGECDCPRAGLTPHESVGLLERIRGEL
jgi:hypothetical protein